MKISFIIPIYNEAGNIPYVTAGIEGVMSGHEPYEIVFANDGSTDNTGEVLGNLNLKSGQIHAVNIEANTGKSWAITKGAEAATGDIFIVMDGDGQIPPENIRKLINMLVEQDLDIVLGSKYNIESKNHSSIARQLFGRTYNWIIRSLLKYNLTDVQSGIKCIRADSFRKLMPLDSIGFDFDLKLINKAVRYGMDISEVPIAIADRHAGHSKVNKVVTSLSLLNQIIEYVIRDHFDPKTISGNYQYRALYEGSRVQRFWHRHKLDLVKHLVKFDASDNVLDAGCGSGNLCFSIAPLCRQVVGIDIFENAIAFAEKYRKKRRIGNCSFIARPLDNTGRNDQEFDKVFMLDVIEHLKDVRSVMTEMKRVTKKNGIIFVLTPNYGSYWKFLENMMDAFNLAPKLKDYQHVNTYTLPSLREEMVKCGFRILASGSTYGLSPFLTKVSEKFADRMYWNEFKANSDKRALAYVIAKREDS